MISKKRAITFSEENYLNYTKKDRPNFACGNYIFPKTRGSKNKPWTHSTPLLKTVEPLLSTMVCPNKSELILDNINLRILYGCINNSILCSQYLSMWKKCSTMYRYIKIFTIPYSVKSYISKVHQNFQFQFSIFVLFSSHRIHIRENTI